MACPHVLKMSVEKPKRYFETVFPSVPQIVFRFVFVIVAVVVVLGVGHVEGARPCRHSSGPASGFARGPRDMV